MSTLENSKYEELCRLCATKTEMFLAINIFEDEGTIRQINKKIDSCLPVQVRFLIFAPTENIACLVFSMWLILIFNKNHCF